jgi:hypothetical protein
MTMGLWHFWLYLSAAWSRTRAWPNSSGQEQGSVGGRLLEGQVLC